MTTTVPYLAISGVIFAFVSLVHLVRAINSWDLIIGTFNIPLVVSWIGFALTAVLSVWAFRLAIAHGA